MVLNKSAAHGLARQGRMEEAIPYFQKVASLLPDSAQAHYELGDALLQRGVPGGAVAEWRRTLEIQPQYADALTGLAWVLSTCANDALRNGPEAVKLALQADRVSAGADPVAAHTLAAAYAETGRFSEAEDAALRAEKLADAQGDASLVERIRGEIDSYKAEMPLRAGAK